MSRPLVVIVAAALVFCAAPASARVAVIRDLGGSSGEAEYQQQVVCGVLDRFGVEYDVIPASIAKTEWCRTGTFNMAWPATNSAYYISYEAVMHLNMYYDISPLAPNYRPDSLTLTAKLPLVPQIFVGRQESGANTSFKTSGGATAESSGVSFFSVAYDGGVADAVGYSAYLVGSPLRWKFDGYAKGIVDTGTVTASGVYSFQVVPGGFRPLVALSMTPASDYACHDCDSIYTEITGAGGAVTRGATIDTLLMWVRQNQHVLGKAGYENGAAHSVFVQPGGATSVIDPSLITMALAYVDSLTGGDIFTNSRLIPAQAGIHIDDGWRRTADYTSSGGIAPSDTSFLKATIDSLASLRVPFVVGVGVDSLMEFANLDSTWWERARPYVHYVPHVHGGTGDINGTLSGIYDMYSGSYAMYRGEECENSDGATPVTESQYCLTRLGFWHLEQRFPGRVDYIIQPPLDDWTPSTVTKTDAGPGVDSLMWVWHRAGAKGVRTNGSGPTSTIMGNVGYQTNPRVMDVRSDPSHADGSTSIGKMNIMLTSGYMATGSSSWQAWSNPTSRFLDGFFLRRVDLSWNSADFQHGLSTITACHVTDLAGRPDNNVALRPAWWQIKYIVNRFKAINKLAGRNICEIAYPDDIRIIQ